jgi:hypothetical protein
MNTSSENRFDDSLALCRIARHSSCDIDNAFSYPDANSAGVAAWKPTNGEMGKKTQYRSAALRTQ